MCLQQDKDFNSFKKILRYLEPYISPQERFCGTKIIRAQERLVLTIRFLATGETFRSLSHQFRISERTISYIIEQVTKAIAHYVGKDYIKTPSSQQQWLDISEIFNSRWNFPNCIGAVDGKHVLITAPPGTGSEFFNYKKKFCHFAGCRRTGV